MPEFVIASEGLHMVLAIPALGLFPLISQNDLRLLDE
jgi:hypothetical protein